MAKKKRKYHKSRHLVKVKLKKQTVNTVGAIWMWIFAAAITLSFFGEGYILVKIREYLAYYIGWTYFLLPPFLITLSFLFFKVKSDIGKVHVPGGLFLLIISLMGLTRTGLIGGFMWDTILKAISFEGALLVFTSCILISIIILFNTSLDKFVEFILSGIQKLSEVIKDWILNIDSKKDLPLMPNSKTPFKIKGSESNDKVFAKSPPAAVLPVSSKTTDKTTTVRSETKTPEISISKPADFGIWHYPPLTLLSDGPGKKADRGDIRKNASTIEKTLDSFGIKARVAEVNTGPAVTQYALEIALGTKVSKITSLSSDMALALAAPTGQVRIEAPIPGRNLVGIEIPNRGLEFVTLKQMLHSEVMNKSKSKLSVALGLDVSGNPIIADIGRMPHVLVAGTTGSGKSVLVNSWINTFLYRTTPQEVRLILVDPKRVELTGYNGAPHLLTPVIVETDKILSALHWSIREMEHRYKQFAEVGVRNIDGFNELSGFQAMPYVVIIIDEFADLMAYAPVDVEDAVCRLAQMARATGIHLVIATQRPSVDVLTGLIKANIPTRIAFNVSSMVDSRVIIDSPGAEKLLGRGDMLYVPPDQSKPSRIQGTYVSETEVRKVVEFLIEKNTAVNYTEEVLTQQVHSSRKNSGSRGMGENADNKDPLFDDALRLICQHDKASASLLQRRMSIGYARAARILDQLEMSGIIGPAEGAKPRDVLIKDPNQFYQAAQESNDISGSQ